MLSLANRLRDDGIDAILDQSHLQLGGRTPEFMERSIRESRSVLVICTDIYKTRFDDRKGGAGYEGHIITAEMISSVGANKFIPVLRSGSWDSAMPAALGGIYGVDFRTDLLDEYHKLVRHLHVVNGIRPVGPPPEWLQATSTKSNTPIGVDVASNIKSPAFIMPQEYGEELKRLPDSDIVIKIWKMPRWRIWSGPEEFKRARFRNLHHCLEFVASAAVRSHARWSQYPWFPTTTPEQGAESIANSIEIDEGSIRHLERWVLFRSGQFVHNAAFDEIPLLGNRTHVLEILDMTTAVFEFVGRMADRKIFSDRVAIAFELFGVGGRQLTWPQDVFRTSDRVGADSWCQDDSFRIDNLFAASVVSNSRRALAFDAALEIYSRFGWTDPPKKDLEEAQQQRFGPPFCSSIPYPRSNE